MIWKNLKKMMNPSTKTIGLTEDADALNQIIIRQMAKFKELARTDDPKGKAGVLEEVPTWRRSFGKGRFVFRKFDKKPFDNAEGFIVALKKRGFKVLGAGAFATVLAKDGQNRVIKVIRRPDGWINYIHWAAQIGEAGHFAPKVFSYKKIKGRKKEFAVAVMERLKVTLDETPASEGIKLLPGLLWRAEENAMAAQFAEVLAPGILDFGKKMAAQWKIPLQNFDLHAGNLMMRSNGQFVVVDPVSKGEEGYARLKEGDFGPLLPGRKWVWIRRVDLP